MIKRIVILIYLLCSISHAQSTYKIGVHLFREEKGPIATQEITGRTLDSIVAFISANHPNRKSSLTHVALVITLDVPWDLTETSSGNYNFEWYTSFARLCETKQIQWVPLLAPHYLPEYIKSDKRYKDHLISYIDGTPYTSFNFLPLSPSSSIWERQVSNWIKAFINAMIQSSHITKDSYSTRAISDILVGNEMMYPFNEATTGDPITLSEWRAQGYPLQDYPTDRDSFIKNWQSRGSGKQNIVRDFRNRELGNCITQLINVVNSQLALRLGKKIAQNIGVSSKLVPYQFPRPAFDRFYVNEFSGYDDQNLTQIIKASNQFVAIDSYTTMGWNIEDDYQATNNRIHDSGKHLFLAEFNKNMVQEHIPLSGDHILEYGIKGFTKYNLRYFVFFAWNPKGSGNIYKITDGQKLGLYRLFNQLSPAKNPMESHIPNPFASGAYAVLPNYHNSSDFSISYQDVDWFTFIYQDRIYYLKVGQNKMKKENSTSKRYGLSIASNALAITAKTYPIAGEPVDTQLWLYDQNLHLLTSDNNSGVDEFSKIRWELISFPNKNYDKNFIRKM